MWRQELCCHKTMNYQRLGERSGTHWSLEPVEEHGPVDTLVLDFWPLEQTENTWLLFSDTQFTVFSHGNPRETNWASLVDYHPLPAPPIWIHLWPWIFFFFNTSLWETNWNWAVKGKLAAVPAANGRQMKAQTWRQSFIISRPQFALL